MNRSMVYGEFDLKQFENNLTVFNEEGLKWKDYYFATYVVSAWGFWSSWCLAALLRPKNLQNL
jgi:hypothetical protein